MMRKLYRWNLLATVAFSAALLVVVSAAGQDAAEDRGGNPPAETMTTESGGQAAQPSALPADQVGPAATDATAGEPADQTADGQPVPSPTKPTRPPWMMLALIVGMVLLFVFM
ncbi:MAG: hypothetical protein HQ546_01710, partial [Planctomycetes bacterium]|nr:hypothetical protein [Planctomycetota bacterium]